VRNFQTVEVSEGRGS